MDRVKGKHGNIHTPPTLSIKAEPLVLETTPVLREKCLICLQLRPSARTSALIPPRMNPRSLSDNTNVIPGSSGDPYPLKMATGGNNDVDERFLCPICREVFTCPVSVHGCGHT